jgi:uncharacterized membrane protein YhaH (DUF805 family)
MAVNVLAAVTIFFVADSIFLKLGGSISAFVKEALLVIAAVAFALAVPSFHVRRMHDRGLSGWLGLAGCLAIVFSIYWIGRTFAGAFLIGGYDRDDLFRAAPALCLLIFTLFHFGVVRGQSGPNRYGPDPLGEDEKPHLR